MTYRSILLLPNITCATLDRWKGGFLQMTLQCASGHPEATIIPEPAPTHLPGERISGSDGRRTSDSPGAYHCNPILYGD